MTDYPDLAEGYQGEWVTYLQQLLGGTAHSPGAEDGRFGLVTASAVLAFQQANGCVPDGWAGRETWGKLAAAAEVPADSADEDEAEQTPCLALRVTAAELDWCDVPEMEAGEV